MKDIKKSNFEEELNKYPDSPYLSVAELVDKGIEALNQIGYEGDVHIHYNSNGTSYIWLPDTGESWMRVVPKGRYIYHKDEVQKNG